MKSRLRVTLLIIGLIIVCCSILAIGYVFWPLENGTIQATLAPTLLTPP